MSGSPLPAARAATPLLPRVPIVAAVVALVSLVASLGVRALAVGPLDVAADTPALTFPLIVIGAVMPVLGNSLGFFLSYRRPGRWSLLGFLVPGALFLVGGSVPVVLHWLDGRDGGALAAGLAVTAVPVALVVPALLLFGRSGQARPEPSPLLPAPPPRAVQPAPMGSDGTVRLTREQLDEARRRALEQR